jgi:hypothetical protein
MVGLESEPTMNTTTRHLPTPSDADLRHTLANEKTDEVCAELDTRYPGPEGDAVEAESA